MMPVNTTVMMEKFATMGHDPTRCNEEGDDNVVTTNDARQKTADRCIIHVHVAANPARLLIKNC